MLLVLAPLALCAAAAGLLLLWVGHKMERPLTLPAPLVVELPPGASFRTAARILERDGLLHSALAFELHARLEGATSGVKSGSYRFAAGTITPQTVLQRITSGTAGGDLQVLLPEGLTRWDVADRLAAAGVCDRAAFLAQLQDEQEGTLFPDTYRFFPGTPPAKVLETLTARFHQTWSRLKQRHPQGLREAQRLGLSERDLLILASIVEREARVAEERPLIARVFLNRLAKGWKLQSDPTCTYSPQHYRREPTARLCHDPRNRFSTYVLPGLPPGPIASPGAASLRAVLDPAARQSSGELMFFVARRDGTGRHDFSRTRKEHERKVERYLRKRR